MFNHFPKIGAFHNVRKSAKFKHRFQEAGHAINYRPKVKLHGTNAGINLTKDGRVIPQSRTQIISVGNDNMGFAAWVEETTEYWKSLKTESPVVIFGEWAGRGIMKGVATSQVEEKFFAVFAVQIGESDNDLATVSVEPDDIEEYLNTGVQKPSNVHVLPWYTDEEIEIDFFFEKFDNQIETMNKMVEKVEAEDPWTKNVYDVSGTGEGLVFYPLSSTLFRTDFSDYAFKAKGEKHKTVKQRQAVQMDPETANSINEFVDKVVTEARLEQGVREIARGEYEFDQKLIGPFIGWVTKDVAKETKDELEESDLEWNKVSKAVTSRARSWYLEQLQKG